MKETLETESSIKGFFGKYRPLSNFDRTGFSASNDEDSVVFKSGEHAFVYHKTLDEGWKKMILEAETPSEAKRLGRLCPLRDGWDDMRVGVMENILLRKFAQNIQLLQLLQSTGYKYLEETNDWGDTFWGVCNGEGYNNLGFTLMRVRDKLRGVVK